MPHSAPNEGMAVNETTVLPGNQPSMRPSTSATKPTVECLQGPKAGSAMAFKLSAYMATEKHSETAAAARLAHGITLLVVGAGPPGCTNMPICLLAFTM